MGQAQVNKNIVKYAKPSSKANHIRSVVFWSSLFRLLSISSQSLLQQTSTPRTSQLILQGRSYFSYYIPDAKASYHDFVILDNDPRAQKSSYSSITGTAWVWGLLAKHDVAGKQRRQELNICLISRCRNKDEDTGAESDLVKIQNIAAR
jgi:hypothetical protein